MQEKWYETECEIKSGISFMVKKSDKFSMRNLIQQEK